MLSVLSKGNSFKVMLQYFPWKTSLMKTLKGKVVIITRSSSQLMGLVSNNTISSKESVHRVLVYFCLSAANKCTQSVDIQDICGNFIS